MKITYIGHAAFAIESGDKRLLFDPWIESNPMAAWTMEQTKVWKPTHIFITHGHRDHGFNEAVELTKNGFGKAISVFELINALAERGGKGIGANIGGRFSLDGMEIYLTEAQHTSPYGLPCGFIVRLEEKIIYHAGDTGVFKGMELISELFNIDLALLPVGGHFTMGAKELPLAKRMLKAKRIIAMHYDTFPPIKLSEEMREEIKKHAEFMKPGENIEI